MGEDNNNQKATFYFRKKENWFKEFLIKIKLMKPKYKKLEIGTVNEITYDGKPYYKEEK